METSTLPRREAHALTVPSHRRTSMPGAARAFASVRSPQGIVRLQASRTEAAIDAELVQRFNGGDEAAFVEIVNRYRERIQSLAGRCLRNQADAEEIAQDTFIRAHRGLCRFRGDSSLATWLHRIAFNLARNRYWYHFRRRRHLTVSLDCPLGSDSTATFSDRVATMELNPARQAAVNEFTVVAAACMEKLADDHREILTMRNLLHWPYEEIATSLGINPGTVKSRIARARLKLRDLIVETCPDFPSETGNADWFEPTRGALERTDGGSVA